MNRLSVRMELQADCFAGVWGHSMQQQGVLETGDLEEALNAAQAIGDDRLQQQSQGRVVPDSFDQLKVVGRPHDRIDGPLKTTGTARYAYEWHEEAPNAAYGYIVG